MSKGIRVDPQYYSTQSYMRKGQKNLPNNEHFTPDPSHLAKIAPVSTNPPTIDDAYDDAYGYDLNEPYEYENKVEEYNAHQGFLEKGFDVEELRMEHETANEWMMRRKFIDAHRFNFPKDRLICLSSCFVNIEKYGARYPQQVMDDIKRLTQGMTEELNKHKQKAKDYTMTNFVRSSGTENKKEDPSQALKRKSAEGAAYAAKKSKMLFVKAAGEFQSTDVTHANEILSGDANEIFSNMSASKERVKDAKETYTGNPMSDPGAIKVLCYKFLRLSKKLNSFTDKSKNAVEHIHNACARTHMQHRADIRHSWESLPICFVCEVYINEVLVGVGRGQKKKDAKHNGYANALVTIKKKFLIVYKNEKPTHGRLELRSSDDPFDNAVFINKRDIMETIEPPKPPTPPLSEESEPTPVPEPSKPTQEDPKKLKPTKKQPLPAKEFVTPPLNPDPAMQTKDLPVINPNPFQDPSLPAPDIMYTKKPAIKIAAKFKSASLVPQPKKQEDTRPLTVQWRDRANNHSNPKIANFVIKEPMEAEDGSAEPLGVLVNSISAAPQCDGNFSVKPGQDGHVGVFSLGGEVIAVGKGATPKDAKRKSAELAMPLLKQWCWTLKTGKPQTDGDKVSKESIGDLSATEGTSGANGNLGSQIEGDNIGGQTTRDGSNPDHQSGTTIPDTANLNVKDKTFTREDIGCKGDINGFRKVIKYEFRSYALSQTIRHIVFKKYCVDFIEIELDVIHEERCLFGLLNLSDWDDFLVIGKVRDLESVSKMDESSDTPNLVPHLKSYTDSQFHVVDKTFARADFGFIDDINGFRKIIKNHLKSYIKSQTVRYIILRDLHENFTEAEIDVLHEEKFRLGLSNTDDTVDLLVCKMKDPKGTSQIGKAVCTPYLVPHLKPVPPLSLESMYTTPDDATVPAIGFDTESDLVCLSDSDDDIYVVDDDDIKGDGVMTWENSDDDDVEYELVETDDEFKEFPDGNVWQFELPPSLHEEFDVPDLDELPILESSIGEKVLESNNDDDNDDLSNRECPNTGKILDPCPISKETTLKSCLKKPCKASGEVEVKEISIQKCKEIKPNEQSDKLEKPNDMSKDHEYPKTKILNPGPISKETSLKSCLKKPKTSGEIMSNEPSDKFEQSKECPKTKILDPGPIPKKTSLKSCLKNTAKISGEVEVILTEAEPNRKENLTQVLLQSCFKKPTPDKNNMKEVSFTPSTKSGPPSLEPGEIGKKMKLRSCFALTQSLAKSCVNAIPMKSDFSRPEKSYHKKTIVDTIPGPFVSKLDITGSEASVNIVADDNISHTQTDNSNMANQNLAGNKAELKSDLHSLELTQQNPLKNPNTLSEEVPQHEVIDLTEDMTDENLTGNDSGVNFGSSSTQELSSKSRNIINDSNKVAKVDIVQPRVIDHAKNIGDENLTEDNSGVVSSLDKVKIIQPRIIDHTKTINDENLTEDNSGTVSSLDKVKIIQPRIIDHTKNINDENLIEDDSREVSGSKQKTLFRKLKTTDKVKAIRPHIVDVTYLSDSDSDSSGSTKMPLDPNHLRQLRNSKVVDLSVYRSSQHKSPEEQDEQNVEELFPKINSSQSQQSKIVTTYNSGMLDPRMIQNSEMQLPSTVQNPGIQQPMMFQNPGMQQPGIVQNPEIQQPRMVQLPEMQQPRMVQNPEMQQPRMVQNPEMQQPRMTQNPEMQQPRMVQNPGTQQPRMNQNFVMQQPRFVQNPEIQQPRMVQNPGMQQPRMIQNPEMQQPRMIQNPEMQQPRMIQYPVMQQPRMVQNLPRMVQNTEMQPPRMIQNPGIHQPRIIQNPKMQQPRMIQNPGIQQPMMVQNPGMQQPGMPQTPGMQQPRIVQNPGIQQPMMVQNPGMQQPGMPQTPGMQQPRIVHNHEIQQPRLVQNLNMQLPRMSQNRGMQQPGIAQNPEIQQPRMIQNPEIQQPRMIQNTGMRQPGMIQNPGMQQQRMNPEMQQPRMVQNPEIQQPRIVQNPGTHQLQIDQKRFPELVHYPSTIQRQFSNTTVMQPSGFVHLVTSQTGVQNPTPGVHQSLIGVQQTSPGVQQSHPGVQQPPSVVQQPLIRVQQPHSGVRLASATFQQPPPGVQQPPPGVQQPPSGVQQPPSGVQQPLIGVQQPHSGVRLASATFQQPPPVVQQPPLGVQQTPSGVQQTSSGVQQPPPGVQQTPSEVQQFSSGVQQPFATIQQASLGVQQPLLGVHQPPLRVQQLPSRVQQSPFEFRQPLHGIQQPPHGSQHHPHEIQEPSHKIQESLPLGILPAIGSTLSVKKASKNPQMSLASYYDEQDAMYGPSEPTDNKSDKKPPLPLEPPLPKEPPSPKEPPLSSPKTMKIETPISPSTNTHGSIPKPTVLPINESSENKSLPSELVENEKGQVSVDNEQNKPAPVKYKQNEPALDENDQTEPALNDGEKPNLDEKKVVKLKQQKRKMEDMYKETLKSTKKMRRDIDEALKQRKRDIEIKKEKERQRKRDIEEEKKRQHLVAIERRERRLMAKIETENDLKRAELKLNAKKRCHESKTWAKHVVNLVETPALDSVEKPALDSFEKSTLDSVQQPPLNSKEMLALDLVETHVKDPVGTTITASGEEINPRTAIDKTIEYQLTELTSCAQNLLKNQHEKLKETAKGVLNNVLVGPQGHTQPSGKKNRSLHSYVDELLDNTYDQYDPSEPTNEETEDGDIVAYDESIHEPNVDLDTCDQEYKENVDGATEKDEKIQQYASIGFKDTICEPKIEERVNVHTRSPSAIEKELYGEDYQPIEIEYPPEESDEEVEYIQEEPLVEEKYVPEESDELERELYGDDYTPIEIKYEDPDKNEFDEADIFERNKEEDFYITQMEQFRKSMHNQNESSEVQDMDDTTSLITISDTEPCINDTDQISNPKMVEEKRSASESEDGLILSHIEILGELEELETKVKVPHRQGTTKKLKERFIAYQSVKSEEPEISEMPTEEDLEEFYKISASAERKTSPRGRKIAGHGPILCYNTPKNHNIPDNQQSMPNQNNVPNQQGLPNQENSADLSNQQHENVQAMIQISDCNKQKADQYHRQKFKKQRYKSKKKPYISKQQQPRQHIVHGVTQAKQETQNENMPRQHSESNQPSKHQHQNEIYPIESKQTLKNETSNPNKGKVLLPTPNIAISLGSSSTSVSDNITGTSKPANHNKEKQPEAQNRRKVLLPTPVQAKAVEKTAVFPTALEVSQPPFHGNINQLPSEVPADQATVFEVSQPPSIVVTTDQSRGDVDLRPPVKEQNATKIFSKDLDLREKETVDRDERKITPKKDTDHRSELSNKDLDLRDHTHYGNQEKLSQKGHKITQDSDLRGEMNTQSLNQKEKIGIEDSDLREKGETQDSNQRIQTTLLDSDQRKLDVDQRDRKPLLDTKPSVQSSSSVNTVIQDKIGKRGRSHAGGDLRGKSYERANPRGQGRGNARGQRRGRGRGIVREGRGRGNSKGENMDRPRRSCSPQSETRRPEYNHHNDDGRHRSRSPFGEKHLPFDGRHSSYEGDQRRKWNSPNRDDRASSSHDRAHSPFEQGHPHFDRGHSPYHWEQSSFERGHSPFERGRSPFERGPSPFERTHSPRRHSPFERGRPQFEQEHGPFDREHGSFERKQGSFEREAHHIERGHSPRRHSPFEGRSHFERGHSPFERGPPPFERGHSPYQNRDHARQWHSPHRDDRGHSPFERRHSPFERRHSPFERRYGSFERRHSPCERRRSPFERRHSPFERGHSPFERRHSPFERRHSPFERGRSPFERRHSPFERGQSPFERRHGPFERAQSPFRKEDERKHWNSPGRDEEYHREHRPRGSWHSPPRDGRDFRPPFDGRDRHWDNHEPRDPRYH